MRCASGHPHVRSLGCILMRSEALALFAGKPYAGAPLTDLAAHLTNTCRARRDAGPERGDREAERPWHHGVDDGVSYGQAGKSAGGVRAAEDGAAGLADSDRDQDSSPSCCGAQDARSGAAAAQRNSETRGGAASGAGGAGGAQDRDAGHGSSPACGAGFAGGEGAGSAQVHGVRCGGRAGWCEEDAVRLVSELPQARTASVLGACVPGTGHAAPPRCIRHAALAWRRHACDVTSACPCNPRKST